MWRTRTLDSAVSATMALWKQPVARQVTRCRRPDTIRQSAAPLPMILPRPRLHRFLGIYLLATGAAGLGGLAIALVTSFRDLTILDVCLSAAAFFLPCLAGWGLWHRGWAAWPWGVAVQLPQILEVATGQRLFRVVIGIYWKVALLGTPPETGFGFAVGVSDPTPQPDLGRWVSLNLVALALTLLLWATGRAGRSTGPKPGAGGPG